MAKNNSNEHMGNKLDRLILNDNCLDRLKTIANKTNIFEILGASTYEIRHSNMLAWLLDPKETHELGDAFLHECIRRVIQNYKDDDPNNYLEDKGLGNDVKNCLGSWLLNSFQNVLVEREVSLGEKNKRLDLVIEMDGYTNEDKHLIVIENKVKAKESKFKRDGESKYQTEEYCDLVRNNYKKYKKKILIYLAANADDRARDKHWLLLSYNDIIEVLETALKGKTIPEASSILINDYIEAIRRNIIGDEEVIEAVDEVYFDSEYKDAIDLILDCVKNNKDNGGIKETAMSIYERHSQELDLIEKNRKSFKALVGRIIRKSIVKQGKRDDNIIVRAKNNNSYIKFQTKKMNVFLGGKLQDDIGAWGTDDKYFYEFDVRADYDKEGNEEKVNVTFYLVLGGRSIP